MLKNCKNCKKYFNCNTLDKARNMACREHKEMKQNGKTNNRPKLQESRVGF